MSTHAPSPLALQTASSLAAQLASMMTTPITLSRYDAGSDAYLPLATVNAYVETPKLLKPAPDEAFTLTVSLDTDALIGDRFDFDGWTWTISDRSTRYTAGIPVAITLLAARLVPLGGTATPGNSAFIPNATIDTRRDGEPYLKAIAAEFSTPRPGAVLPEGEPIDYLVLVPMATDIEMNDVILLTEYAGTVLADPDTLIVRARMWQGAAPNALRRLLVRATVIGGV
jgi:hypothetical protein